MERRYGIDTAKALRIAECDGGFPVRTPDGQVVGVRQQFRGRLTGVYYEEGEPPWRWYELTELSLKPAEHAAATVWCESGFLFLVDEA